MLDASSSASPEALTLGLLIKETIVGAAVVVVTLVFVRYLMTRDKADAERAERHDASELERAEIYRAAMERVVTHCETSERDLRGSIDRIGDRVACRASPWRDNPPQD